MIAPEQFESRQDQECITVALNKRLTFDILQAFHLPDILCSNDTKACYDYIVHNVAMIYMLRTGILYNSLKFVLLILQKMQHKVATGYGVYEPSYAADSKEITIQGIGQGNGAGPTVWAVISSPLFEMLRSTGFEIELISCLLDTSVTLVGYSFVDDTDILFTTDSEEAFIQTAQERLNLWESNLSATGGAINTGKNWFGIGFVREGEEWRYKTLKELPSDLTIKNFDNITATITRDTINPEILVWVWVRPRNKILYNPEPEPALDLFRVRPCANSRRPVHT